MLLTENLLDDWVRGQAEMAQGVIVEAIWRLVAASSPKPQARRFPLGDSIGQRGRDGYLEVALGLEPYFPDGVSVWEIGTGIDPATKASTDYRNAKNSMARLVRQQATFIFVTPLSGRRGWDADSQRTWVRRRQNGGWKSSVPGRGVSRGP